MNWKNFWTAHIATQNPTKDKKNGKNAWVYGKSSHLKKNYWKRKDIHSKKKGNDKPTTMRILMKTTKLG